MRSISDRLIALTPIGTVVELPGAGTSLENPFVYDAAAREVKERAQQGWVEIVDEQFAVASHERLISRLAFRRLR